MGWEPLLEKHGTRRSPSHTEQEPSPSLLCPLEASCSRQTAAVFSPSHIIGKTRCTHRTPEQKQDTISAPGSPELLRVPDSWTTTHLSHKDGFLLTRGILQLSDL